MKLASFDLCILPYRHLGVLFCFDNFWSEYFLGLLFYASYIIVYFKPLVSEGGLWTDFI